MDIEQARKFGQMESRMDSLESSHTDLRKQVGRIEDKMDIVVERLAGSAGGTKMLVTLLTLSAALGGILTKLWELFAK